MCAFVDCPEMRSRNGQMFVPSLWLFCLKDLRENRVNASKGSVWISTLLLLLRKNISVFAFLATEHLEWFENVNPRKWSEKVGTPLILRRLDFP